MPITPIGSHRSLLQSISPPEVTEAPSLIEQLPSQKGTGEGFAHRLTDALQEVNQLQAEADAGLQAVAAGHADSLPEAVMAMNKADLALQLTIQITNRAIEAYKQVSQMQI